MKEEDPEGALKGFQGVLDLEEKKHKKEEWGFKALKQMLKLQFKMVIRGEKFKNGMRGEGGVQANDGILGGGGGGGGVGVVVEATLQKGSYIY